VRGIGEAVGRSRGGRSLRGLLTEKPRLGVESVGEDGVKVIVTAGRRRAEVAAELREAGGGVHEGVIP
jgi:hypothetical protein